jgi:small-conductance mechanosensitive channel
VGEVREIVTRATTLVTDEHVAVIVPNSQFISERVINWSRPNALTAYVLTFYVPRDFDPDRVRRTLLEAATGHERVLRSPAPEVEFVQVGMRGLSFLLQVWSREDRLAEKRLEFRRVETIGRRPLRPITAESDRVTPERRPSPDGAR